MLLPQMEGSCFSLSALERRIGAIFFYWDVYNMFLQVCSLGASCCAHHNLHYKTCTIEIVLMHGCLAV